MTLLMAPTAIQWNCRSIRHKKSEVISLINNYNPILLAIAETWLKPSSRFRVPGFSCLRDDNDDGWNGCAILIKHTLPFSLIPTPPHSAGFNIVACKALNLTFVSLYIPHPNIAIISELDSILSLLPGPLVVMGDFNCHHTMWGSASCDSYSSRLIDVFDNVNLCLMNDGSPTRRTSPLQNRSSVDLTLVSPRLASRVVWETLTLSHGSDHLPILISLPSDLSIPVISPSPLLKYRLDQADWPEFSSFVSNEVDLLPSVSEDNFLPLYFKFISILSKAADSSIPLKNSAQGKLSSPPWWDAECTAAIKKRNEAEGSFASDLSSYEFYLHFQSTNARTKRLLSTKKRLGWTRFCESLSPRTPATLVWKNIKRFRGSMSATNISSNDPSAWIDAFLDKLAPPYVPFEDALPFSSSCSPSNDRMDEPFSSSELFSVLEHLQDSSPGIDGIPYSFIKKCSESSKLFFLSIINQIYFSGIIPNTWKTQIIAPILKPGKNPSDPSAYRPIALSSVLAKIMEHLIKNRLEWILESRGILSNSQFGFRRGMGTMDSLSILTSDIRLAFSRGQHVVGVFLDVTSAYDNVQLPLLRQKMHQLSLPVRMVNVICNLFMDRSICVRLQGSLLPPRNIWKGLPQGSVLSPILYSLYTADLDKSVNCFCDILQYADDIALYFASDSISECSVALNSGLSYLNAWLTDHGLSLSASKSSVVVFTRKRRIPDIDILLDDEIIPVSNCVKFLGLYLDARLTGIPHLNFIRNKCEKSVNVLRSLSGAWWGSHPFSQKLLYNAIIRSHFDYGSFLLEPCSKIALSCLDKIQSKCLRIICGAMKSSPINALQVECLDPPLRLRRQLLADRFFFRAAQSSDHPLIYRMNSLANVITSSKYWTHKDLPCLIKSFQKLSEVPLLLTTPGNPIFHIPYDALIYRPNVIFSLGLKKSSPGTNNDFLKILAEKWDGWLHIFTDASKLSKEGYVGSAVWIPRYKILLSYKSPPPTSVFTGEAIALYEAISFIESHKIAKVVIFSDSLSCLQDLAKCPLRSRDNLLVSLKSREVLHRCDSLGLEVVLAWVPSHSGIEGNEQADAGAKQAIEIGCTSHSGCHSQDLRAYAKTQLTEHWSQEWNITRLSKGRHYGGIQPNLPVRPWFFKYQKASKTATSTIIRLRLGHICSPSFLAKIRVRDHSLCECGLEEGTADHIFFNCPKTSSSLYDLLPDYIQRPANLSYILSFVNTSFVYVLANFINKFNIKL